MCFYVYVRTAVNSKLVYRFALYNILMFYHVLLCIGERKSRFGILRSRSKRAEPTLLTYFLLTLSELVYRVFVLVICTPSLMSH